MSKEWQISHDEIEALEAERDHWRELAMKAREALGNIESFDTTRFFEGSPIHIDPEVKIIVGPCAELAKQALALFPKEPSDNG